MKRLLTIVASAVALSGCVAGGGFGAFDEATFFADPATYAMYDCKQLEPVRASQTSRVAELKALMLKAETGPGGAVIAELAYRTEYISAEARLKSVNQHWQRNGCDQQTGPAGRAGGKRADPGRGGVY